MASQQDVKPKLNVAWTAADEATLVEAFVAQKRDGNTSENGWKSSAYQAVVLALEGSEKISRGAPKTVATVKSRWQRLKGEYLEVKKLRNLSGFSWDEDLKLVMAAPDVWDSYLKVSSNTVSAVFPDISNMKAHPKASPWRRKAFPLYDMMAELVDGTVATGDGVFQPGLQEQAATARERTTSAGSSI